MYKSILFISLKTPSSCGLYFEAYAGHLQTQLNSCGDAKPFFKWGGGGGKEPNYIIQSLFGPTYTCYKFLYQILKHCEQG